MLLPEADVPWKRNPFVTVVRAPHGLEMGLSRMWATHRLGDTLELDFMFHEGGLSLPSSPDEYPEDPEDGGCPGPRELPRHPHLCVSDWRCRRMPLPEALERIPAECHAAWSRPGDRSLEFAVSVRGFDSSGRLAAEVLFPRWAVWYGLAQG